MHPKMEISDGRCFVCGSTEHLSKSCTRPTEAKRFDKPKVAPAGKSIKTKETDVEAVVAKTLEATMKAIMNSDIAKTVDSVEAKKGKVRVPETVLDSQILLDGGATHDIWVADKRPRDGSSKVDVELASGQVKGYLKNGEVTVVDPAATKTDKERPKLVSLGRLIFERNLKLRWDANGHLLKCQQEKC